MSLAQLAADSNFSQSSDYQFRDCPPNDKPGMTGLDQSTTESGLHRPESVTQSTLQSDGIIHRPHLSTEPGEIFFFDKFVAPKSDYVGNRVPVRAAISRSRAHGEPLDEPDKGGVSASNRKSPQPVLGKSRGSC